MLFAQFTSDKVLVNAFEGEWRQLGLSILCSKSFLFFSAAIPLNFAYFAHSSTYFVHYLLSIKLTLLARRTCADFIAWL